MYEMFSGNTCAGFSLEEQKVLSFKGRVALVFVAYIY